MWFQYCIQLDDILENIGMSSRHRCHQSMDYDSAVFRSWKYLVYNSIK